MLKEVYPVYILLDGIVRSKHHIMFMIIVVLFMNQE